MKLVNHKGSVSGYFLVLFLLVISICSVMLKNDINRIQTMDNLNKASKAFESEKAVILDIKDKLINEIESGSYDIQGINYVMEVKEKEIEVYINNENQSHLIISYDGNRIMDYECERLVIT